MERKQQADYRDYHEEWTDQHGRRFGAWYEIDTFRPIGEFKPIDSTPPWLPPMKYIKWERKNGFRFQWDYESLADEFAGHTASYYEEAAEYAMAHNIPAPEVGGPIDYRIRGALKRPPLSPALPLACKLGNPWLLGMTKVVDEEMKAILYQTAASTREMLEKIQARLNMQQANSGIAPIETIEFETNVDATAKPRRSISDIDYDPAKVTYQEFSKALYAQGKSQGETVELWKEHKKLIAEVAA
jgi:hypothetical protein